MTLDNAEADGQPQACALSFTLRRKERVKNAGGVRMLKCRTPYL